MRHAPEPGGRCTALATPVNPSADATRELSAALTMLLSDMLAVYVKTNNFRWHMSGPHFRDYQLLLDEQSTQILRVTDAAAKRVRKIGGTTLHSVSHVSRLQRILDNDANFVAPQDMLAELRDDNGELVRHLRLLHALCGDHRDVATASLVETWIDEAEMRIWFLFQVAQALP